MLINYFTNKFIIWSFDIILFIDSIISFLLSLDAEKVILSSNIKFITSNSEE